MVFWGHVAQDEAKDCEHFHPESDPCPWVILSADVVHRRLPIAIVAPMTSKLHKAEEAKFRGYRIRLPSEQIERFAIVGGTPLRDGDSLVLIEQIRVFAHERLMGNPVAQVSTMLLAGIETGIKEALDLG